MFPKPCGLLVVLLSLFPVSSVLGGDVEGSSSVTGNRQNNKARELVSAYSVSQAKANQVAEILGSLFPVVNHRDAYFRFAFDKRKQLLIVIASEQHQKQAVEALSLLGANVQRRIAEKNAVKVKQRQHLRGKALIQRDIEVLLRWFEGGGGGGGD